MPVSSESGRRADHHRDDPIFLNAEDDKWAWRRTIRSDPRKHRIYRVVIAVVGVTLLLLAAATGWLPGPGGIPLALVGLAVLASEFEWAQRLLDWAKARAHQLGRWSARQPSWLRVLCGLATLACILLALWFTLRLFGIPGWAPGVVTGFLADVPGLR